MTILPLAIPLLMNSGGLPWSSATVFISSVIAPDKASSSIPIQLTWEREGRYNYLRVQKKLDLAVDNQY